MVTPFELRACDPSFTFQVNKKEPTFRPRRRRDSRREKSAPKQSAAEAWLRSANLPDNTIAGFEAKGYGAGRPPAADAGHHVTDYTHDPRGRKIQELLPTSAPGRCRREQERNPKIHVFVLRLRRRHRDEARP